MTVQHQSVYISDEVRETLRLHNDIFTDDFRRLAIRYQLDQQARRIVEAHELGDVAAVTHIKCWHPNLVGHSTDEIMGCDLSLEDARETIAREYGFASWGDAEERGVDPVDADFESAVDTLLCGKVDVLREQLMRKPALVHQRSAFGHRATLLHYCGSNGVETYRQVVPRNLAEVTQVLLDSGADVNATADMYGGGSTTIALLISSSHPAEAGVTDEVVKVLVDAGATTD